AFLSALASVMMRPAKFDAMHLRDFEHRHHKYLDPLGISRFASRPRFQKRQSISTESYERRATADRHVVRLLRWSVRGSFLHWSSFWPAAPCSCHGFAKGSPIPLLTHSVCNVVPIHIRSKGGA